MKALPQCASPHAIVRTASLSGLGRYPVGISFLYLSSFDSLSSNHACDQQRHGNTSGRVSRSNAAYPESSGEQSGIQAPQCLVLFLFLQPVPREWKLTRSTGRSRQEPFLT